MKGCPLCIYSAVVSVVDSVVVSVEGVAGFTMVGVFSLE